MRKQVGPACPYLNEELYTRFEKDAEEDTDLYLCATPKSALKKSCGATEENKKKSITNKG